MESPYAGLVKRNVAYAQACMRDCLMRGEAPFASHLLYTQPGILDDNDPDERQLGIDVGLLWAKHADATAIYFDLGESGGMRFGIQNAIKAGRPFVNRTLPDDLLLSFAEQALAAGQLKDLPPDTRARLIHLNFTAVEPGPV